MSSAWNAVASGIDACRQQLRQCERVFADYNNEPHGEEILDGERSYLAHLLLQTHLRLLLVIESAGRPLFLARYNESFAKYIGKLDEVEHLPQDPDYMYSNALIYLDQVFEALKETTAPQTDSNMNELRLLTRMLKQTPHIIHDQNLTPSCENDVKHAIYNTLKIAFPTAKIETKVSKIFKTYRIDITISSLKAAVEVKYAASEKELKTEIDGIYADMRGYAGDSDWEYFFALFYTTQPIAYHERLIEEFKSAGADPNWKPIIVHGAGNRSRGASAPPPGPKKRAPGRKQNDTRGRKLKPQAPGATTKGTS